LAAQCLAMVGREQWFGPTPALAPAGTIHFHHRTVPPASAPNRYCRRKLPHTTHLHDISRSVTILRERHPFEGRALMVISCDQAPQHAVAGGAA
jgi:hypothetical protein